MSNVITGMLQQKRVGSQTRKAVLMHMAAIASDDGSGIWTSKANMAADLEMGRRTVQNCIEDLIEAGLVLEVGKKTCKHGFTVEYRIVVDAVSRLQSTRAGDAPVREMHMTRAGDAPQDVQELHINRPRTIHEPSLTPKVPFETTGFEEFYAAFPRKKEPKAARRAFERALRDVDAETLIEAAKNYAREKQGVEPRFIKHPATWLNKGSWADQPDETPSSTFHDNIENMLRGDTNDPRLRDEIASFDDQPERLSSPIPSTRDRRGEPDAPVEIDGRGDEQAHLSLIKPRRFGGSR